MNEDLTLVIPYRGDESGCRTQNAHFVIEHFSRICPRIVLAEHSATPDPVLQVPRGVLRIHVGTCGPFSKSVACNAGYSMVRTPLLAFIDADMLIRGNTLLASARTAMRTGAVIRPYGLLKNISLSEVASGGLESSTQPIDVQQSSNEREGERIPLCGGIVIMPTLIFESVGGMDENFLGWGGEDDALSAALVRTGTTCRILRSQVALHMRHPRDPKSRYGHDHYVANRERAFWWWNASEAEILAGIAAGRSHLRSIKQV